jgi:hypothetical protein
MRAARSLQASAFRLNFTSDIRTNSQAVTASQVADRHTLFRLTAAIRA